MLTGQGMNLRGLEGQADNQEGQPTGYVEIWAKAGAD